MSSTTVNLESVRTIVGVIARERTRGFPDKYDDALQEGMICAWQVLQKRPDAPRAYVIAAARNGVTSSSLGRAPFGKAPMRGSRQVDAFPFCALSSVDGEDSEEERLNRLANLAQDPWNAVDTKMDVEAAMEQWSAEQRKLAYLVFYCDMTMAEASAWLGKAPQWGEREMRYLKAGQYESAEERMSRAQSARSRQRNR